MTDNPGAKPVARREFLRAATRTSIASGLLGATALLVLRPPRPRGTCLHVPVCGDCQRFDRCDLPKAQLSREAAGSEESRHA